LSLESYLLVGVQGEGKGWDWKRAISVCVWAFWDRYHMVLSREGCGTVIFGFSSLCLEGVLRIIYLWHKI
jgi:hypothetical protein